MRAHTVGAVTLRAARATHSIAHPPTRDQQPTNQPTNHARLCRQAATARKVPRTHRRQSAIVGLSPAMKAPVRFSWSLTKPRYLQKKGHKQKTRHVSLQGRHACEVIDRVRVDIFVISQTQVERFQPNTESKAHFLAHVHTLNVRRSLGQVFLQKRLAHDLGLLWAHAFGGQRATRLFELFSQRQHLVDHEASLRVARRVPTVHAHTHVNNTYVRVETTKTQQQMNQSMFNQFY